MKMKHTQGNFSVLPTNPIKQWINITSDKGIIARSFYGDEKPIVTKEEAEANAKLMASAPELLESLKDMIELWERVHKGTLLGKPSLNKALNTIKKATT